MAKKKAEQAEGKEKVVGYLAIRVSLFNEGKLKIHERMKVNTVPEDFKAFMASLKELVERSLAPK